MLSAAASVFYGLLMAAGKDRLAIAAAARLAARQTVRRKKNARSKDFTKIYAADAFKGVILEERQSPAPEKARGFYKPACKKYTEFTSLQALISY